jgi:Domain of unknown function (DUF4157)
MTGFALPAGVRRDLEAAFGARFGQVRVHTDGEGTRDGQVAWTLGDNIHISAGAWPPDTPWRRRVLGHEVVHVVQQRVGRVGRGADRRALEAEAHAAGERFALGLAVRLPGGAGGPLAVPTPAVQCWNSVAPAGRAGANVTVGASIWSSPTAAQDAFIGQDNLNLAAVPAPGDLAVSFLNAAGNLNLVSANPANVTLRVSANGRLAIEDCVLTARQPKVCYATQALIDESNNWRRAVGNAVTLIPDSAVANQTITINGQVLRRVTLSYGPWGGLGIAAVGPQNCNDVVNAALGAGYAEIAAPDGIGALPLQLPESEVARFMVNPAQAAVSGAPLSIQQANTARVIAAAYGAALLNNTLRQVAGVPADRHFGVNQYAAPGLGEAFCLCSLQAVPAGSTLMTAQLSTDYSRAGTPVLDAGSFWSAHWASVVLKDGSDVITLENYARNTEAAPSDAARARIGYYFQMYDTAPGAPPNHTFHGSWTGAAVRAANPAAVPADAGVPPGTTHRPVPNGVKTFVNPLTLRAVIAGPGYLGMLPGTLGNLTSDQLQAAYTDLQGTPTPLVQLTTMLKGLLYAQQLADKNKPVKLAIVTPWKTVLGALNDPAVGTDQRLRTLVAYTKAQFDALPTA